MIWLNCFLKFGYLTRSRRSNTASAQSPPVIARLAPSAGKYSIFINEMSTGAGNAVFLSEFPCGGGGTSQVCSRSNRCKFGRLACSGSAIRVSITPRSIMGTWSGGPTMEQLAQMASLSEGFIVQASYSPAEFRRIGGGLASRAKEDKWAMRTYYISIEAGPA